MTTNTLIIGAGALGLACAARLATAQRSVVIAEQARLIGAHTSSRNSEVIHAGLYYPPDSLKARLCLDGRERLYHWCAAHQVPHQRIGKLLIAVENRELPALERLAANAQACGINELEPLSQRQLHALEPAVRGVQALRSPNTGIIDSHAYLLSLLAHAERHGASLALDTRIERLQRRGDHWLAEGMSGDQPFSQAFDEVINASGLWASQLATQIDGFNPTLIPTTHWCRGRYFSYTGRSPFRHLIYPMPEVNTAGLGIHATLDLGGQLRFGPDVDWSVAPCAAHVEPDYRINEQLREPFASTIRRYFPQLEAERLQPAYAGIRPKLSMAGEPAADFVLQGPREHGLPALVNLYGIESPGLTASLALAEQVAALLA